MLYFENDYSKGAHPLVLKALIDTNNDFLSGYGSDKYTSSAKEKILKACDLEDGQVTFLSGGTQTNMIVITSMLKPYEGVIAAKTGHISTHEAGAIEAHGHKVLTIPEHMGKMRAKELREYLETFYDDENHSHMVYPGMVYLSHPTEYGTLYTQKELTDISLVCNEYHMPLYLDGARLGYALASESDLSLKDIAHLTDVFYIGGTKVGALCGEAVVFTHHNELKHFVTMVKSMGGLMAKGRVLGVQFDALFTDDLYIKISKNAIETAMALKQGLLERGYHFLLDSPTNQQFIILENSKMKDLRKNVVFSFWEKYDDTHTVIRLATDWSTSMEDVESLLTLMS